ncbi:hypothetical protein [Thioalkalivibrio sp. AL5]|uniref:hypothetical protein n=1 Tax=Thioalkalivibrio sp. AL5 TaxID=1158149 RepID=UPI00037AAF93|nr:hypothetical protein [Thioalkalivibrio sp. AL5]
MTVSDNGAGSAAVVPYYTINEGWRTLLNVTNTTDNSMVIKVRLHEARNSRDVLDFNVALSPRDVWTAWISADEDGRPVLRTEDTSCTIPLSVRDEGATANELAYSGTFSDHTDTDGDISRMSEGYIEILTMGEAEAGAEDDEDTLPWAAKHVDGTPRDCGMVDQAFVADASWAPADFGSTIPGEQGSGDPAARGEGGYGPITSSTPLKVNASLVNQRRGIAAGVESLHLADFGNGENFITAQQFPYFLEPTLVSGDTLWSMDGLDDFTAAIGSSTVANEWASNPQTGAATDWVLTFPTKRFYTDVDRGNIQAACNDYRNTGTGGGAFDDGSACPANIFGSATFQDDDDGQAVIEVGYDIYDREEGSFRVETDGTTVSPAPPPEVTIDTLIYEANVVKIARNASEMESALNSAIARSVDTNQLVSNSNTGWAEISFDSALPVTGFIFKQRDFGDPSRNYGQATEHAYDTNEPR